jgi:anti-sigma regulatory factor (Ser/Thr protein kinase)
VTAAGARAHWAFPRRPSSAAEARAVTRTFFSALEDRRPAGQRSPAGVDEETAVLAVSELVANAVLHADARPGDIELTLEARAGALHIEVEDCDPRPPVAGTGTFERERGRGLLIVDRVAARWGWSAIPENGKAVWCDLGEVPE